MPLKRLIKKTTVENLWIYILSLLREQPMYAYEIPKKIKENFGFEIGNVTAYIILYKLENSDYVETKWKFQNNRQRKYYAITEKGKKLLNDGALYLEGLLKKIKR